ncbi:MAG: uroporphyrinogen-III synthase [Flavobacterium sp.]|jgi:uroporphyrinogen-III synthase
MNAISILSTKKLSDSQKEYFNNANFSYFEADFIEIESSDFTCNLSSDYSIITSQNAIESILKNKDAEQIKFLPCFCVGSKTKILLEKNGFKVIETSDYAAELASIICNKYQKKSFLFFSGNLRRDILPEAMQLANVNFTEVVVYKTTLKSHKIESNLQGILFFSPSAVESYLQKNTITNQTCFCIGKTTAEALETNNTQIPNQPTIENTIIQCINYYGYNK